MMKTKLTAYFCKNSAYKALEALKKPLPKHIKAIKVPCAGRVESAEILKNIEDGAHKVLILACPIDNCKHINGNCRAQKRVEMINKTLREVSPEKDRVQLEFVSQVDTHRLKEILAVY
ncbi:MAG: hydrogenase iron-sulfur subunit [Kiritimatiellae bacterium]|nr:hydrogenase iron-sulfur subunit [Kiritimatiellia bacterium]